MPHAARLENHPNEVVQECKQEEVDCTPSIKHEEGDSISRRKFAPIVEEQVESNDMHSVVSTKTQRRLSLSERMMEK